ncbi:CPBP family intramembrane glutamic endopeptidase [Sandarakinorhabdus sp.]|uniref:CPBP family intramembrane glutamic endopeptidase, BDIM_20840 family n=1 Tax=Sandarakinorhabdus sp. TaxID=1916663 RepID=UPI00333FBA20
MNGLISLAAVLGILFGLGAAIGAADRRHFAPAWLAAAAALVAINDALLTNGYGLLPDMIGGNWNWQGKLLALAATLAIAALPGFGWRRCGITLVQAPGSLRAALPVALLYCAFFAAIALAFPGDGGDTETLLFQLSLPGLEEEAFYRGLLLVALGQAFTARKRLLGVDCGWSAILSCLLFGLAHAFSFAGGSFSFDAITMALTAVPAFLGVWMWLRTGSLLLPVLLHNVGNSLSLLI